MGLIRANHAPPTLRAFSMADIEQHARAILAKAAEQARQALAAAAAEAEALKAQAHAAGLAEGRAQGLTQGRDEGHKAGHDQALAEHRAQLISAITALTAATQEIENHRRDLQSAALQDVIELAIAIAERVTKRHGELDPSVALANVAEALKLVTHASDLRLAIHPSQLATLQREMPALKLQFPSLKHVELIEDPALAPGGCRIFTTQGQIDGDLNEQLRRVVADLLPERAARKQV